MPTEEKSTDSKADCKLQSIDRVEIMRFFILIEPGTNLFFPKGKKLDSTHFLPSARRNFLLLHYLSYLGFQECDCLYFSTVTIFGDRCICRQQNSRILRWPWMRALVKWNGLEYEWKRSDTSVFRLQVGAFHFWRVASYEQRFRFKRDKLNCNLFTMFADSKCSLAAKNLCIKPMVTWVESLMYFFWSGCNQSIN